MVTSIKISRFRSRLPNKHFTLVVRIAIDMTDRKMLDKYCRPRLLKRSPHKLNARISSTFKGRPYVS